MCSKKLILKTSSSKSQLACISAPFKILFLTGIYLFAFLFTAHAQRVIKGKVVDGDSKEPLEGVSVNPSPTITTTTISDRPDPVEQ